MRVRLSSPRRHGSPDTGCRAFGRHDRGHLAAVSDVRVSPAAFMSDRRGRLVSLTTWMPQLARPMRRSEVRERRRSQCGHRRTTRCRLPTFKLLTCLDAPSTRASRAVGCEVGDRLTPKLLANLPGVARATARSRLSRASGGARQQGGRLQARMTDLHDVAVPRGNTPRVEAARPHSVRTLTRPPDRRSAPSSPRATVADPIVVNLHQTESRSSAMTD